MPWKIHMGKSKRENQIKISYFLSSFTDYRSIFYVLEQYAQVGGGERGEGRSPELWWMGDGLMEVFLLLYFKFMIWFRVCIVKKMFGSYIFFR